METERCPACGWPTPKGRPCPRGCGALAPTPSLSFHATPVQAAFAPQSAIVPQNRRSLRHKAGPTGIGGLLLLPVIGLFATICRNGWTIYHDLLPFRDSEAWAVLTSPGSEVYNPLWQPLLLFEFFATVVMVVAPLALLVAIFLKRQSAPRFAVAFYVFCCLAVAVDSGAVLLFLADWLRAAGLGEAAADLSTSALYGLYQAGILAFVWIPYFLFSRRVKNTFTRPVRAARADRVPVTASAYGSEQRSGRLRAALAVLAVAVVAGGAVYASETYLRPAPAADVSVATASGESESLTSEGGATTYYEQWSAFMERSDLDQALEVATKITVRFPDSREAWFVLGYTEEAKGDFVAATSSYTRSLTLPEKTATGDTGISDMTVRKRLDLVTYVTAITEPRVAIASAVNEVNTILTGENPDAVTLSNATSQAVVILDTNIARLESMTVPAYFAVFHAGMLAAYDALQSACDELAAAVSPSADPQALASARAGLDAAIDSFNRNDTIGTSLINEYYGQEPPVALIPPDGPGT